MSKNNFIKPIAILFSVICLLFLVLLVARPIHLTTADLGEEIRSGQIIWQTGRIIKSNIFSFSATGFPVVDHHWGTEVIFYLVYKLTSFNGLSIFFYLVTSVTFILVFLTSSALSGLDIALFGAVLTIPLIGNRTEIRPEMFTNLFTAIFLSVLFLTHKKIISRNFLYFLPVLEVFWVNLHIYFFLGPLFLIIFLTAEFIKRPQNKPLLKSLLAVSIFTLTATLVNPNFIRGALLPLLIYRNYGLKVVEEQPVWIIDQYYRYVPIVFFKIISLILITSLFSRLKNKSKDFFIASLLTFFCIVFGAIMIRNLVLFGYISLLLISFNLNLFFDAFPNIKKLIPIFLIISLLITFAVGRTNFDFLQIGLGLPKKEPMAAKFFIDNRLSGPIFNNYDIGSYLVFYLYPKEKVFVDYNPNAYPSGFFNKTYVPMKEDESVWRLGDKKYHFNSIFIYLNPNDSDLPGFIRRRVADLLWSVVYLDDERIILLKRDQANSAIIKKFGKKITY